MASIHKMDIFNSAEANQNDPFSKEQDKVLKFGNTMRIYEPQN